MLTVDFEDLTIDGKDAFLQPAVEPSIAESTEPILAGKDGVKDADTDDRSAEVQYRVFDLVHQDAASIVKMVSHVVPETERKSLRIAAHTRTNSVVASGRSQKLAVLEELIGDLEQPNHSANGSQDRRH